MSDSGYPQLKSKTSKFVRKSFKIVIVGESGVGKSSLLSQFVHRSFINDFVSTIGIDFGTKTINIRGEREGEGEGEGDYGDENPEYRLLLKIFDTAGQKRFRTISEHYQSNNVDGVVVLVDVTSALSFESASEFISRARELSGRSEDLPIILIGNKKDLVKTRCISYDELEALAQSCKVDYREISVKESPEECEAVFRALTQEILRLSKNYNLDTITINVDKDVEPKELSLIEKILSNLGFCFCMG